MTALAGSCALAMTSNAMAATNGPTTSPEAIGVYANGLVSITNSADETTIGQTATDPSVSITGYLTASTLSATVVSANYDYASVADLSTILAGPTITSGTITEYCVTTAAGTFSSYAVIENLVIGSLSFNGTVYQTDYALGVSGVLTVTLNQEVTGPASETGSETWNAIDISVGTGGSTEDIDIASATCGPYTVGAATPLASGLGLGIGLGGLGLFGGTYATIRIRRRNAAGVAI
jgi:hypothetical protein